MVVSSLQGELGVNTRKIKKHSAVPWENENEKPGVLPLGVEPVEKTGSTPVGVIPPKKNPGATPM